MEFSFSEVAQAQRLAFCVGVPKSGTHSIAELFAETVRCAHEPFALDLIRLILAGDRRTSQQRKDYLQSRQLHMRLRLEATHMLVFVLEDLLNSFPTSQFILTVREPGSWLDSMINQQLGTEASQEWLRFRDHRFADPVHRHHPAARVLEDHGLYPLDSYLAYWAWHNARVLQLVPKERLIVVRTPDIATSGPRIAEFLEMDPAQMVGRTAHAFQAVARHDIVSRIDPDYLADRIAANCEAVIQQIDAFNADPAERSKLSRAF